MRVQEAMSEVVITVSQDVSVADAASTMAREGVGCLIVTDENAIKGIVTDRDIVIRCVSERMDPVSSPIGKYVSSPVRSVKPTDDIVDAARLMAHARVKRLLVLDGPDSAAPAGLISYADVARAMEQPMHDLLAVEGMDAVRWDA
jgi:signal-transduction protein with cAMP-binding, CBS, and nucleotidyltransferase domain